MREHAVDELLGLLHVDVPDHVEHGVVRAIVRGVVLLDVIHRPLADEVLLTDGEPLGQDVLLVQAAQDLALNPVLHGVHHLGFAEHGGTLLLHPRLVDPRLQHVHHRLHGQREQGHSTLLPFRLTLARPQSPQDPTQRAFARRPRRRHAHERPGLSVRGARGVEHRVVEVRVRVGLAPGAEEPVPLGTAHIRDVLQDVRHPLLLVQLVGAAGEQLQVHLEAPRRTGVGQHRVVEAVLQRAHLNTWMKRQRSRFGLGRRLHSRRGRRDALPSADMPTPPRQRGSRKLRGRQKRRSGREDKAEHGQLHLG
mmetsp:Transcript_16856/g.64197  ORF Transcript_16856/g.64197 Transcript_16856/m.64197 type:complete len:308 (-) Transcript_16856:153-1076(-)